MFGTQGMMCRRGRNQEVWLKRYHTGPGTSDARCPGARNPVTQELGTVDLGTQEPGTVLLFNPGYI